MARRITTNKLKTALLDGGSCLWVPEDETQLITKEITENGVYRASDDGAYGFSEIIVNISCSSGSDDPGGDSPGGETPEEPTLTGISVTSLPSKQEYTEGEPIEYTGLELTAYYSDGTAQDVTDACEISPAAGSAAVYGAESITITYTQEECEPVTTSFSITVRKKQVKTVKALQLMPTTYEESLAKIQSVLSIPSKMLQRIESKRSSVFGGASLNIVLSAGYCNYKGSGSLRFTLSDITPYIGDNPLFQYYSPAPGVSQGVMIPSGEATYREFFPHQYCWDNCTGNGFLYMVASEGEIQKDSAYSTPWLSDLCIGFGSDVFDYNPFSSNGSQPYQAYAANYLIVDVEDPRT